MVRPKFDPATLPGWDGLTSLQAICVGFDLMPRDERSGPRTMAALARARGSSESTMRDAKRRGYEHLRRSAIAKGVDLDALIACFRKVQA